MISKRDASREQLDWRWSARYRELVQYDAYHWLTPAAFSPAENVDHRKQRTPP